MIAQLQEVLPFRGRDQRTRHQEWLDQPVDNLLAGIAVGEHLRVAKCAIACLKPDRLTIFGGLGSHGL